MKWNLLYKAISNVHSQAQSNKNLYKRSIQLVLIKIKRILHLQCNKLVNKNVYLDSGSCIEGQNQSYHLV